MRYRKGFERRTVALTLLTTAYAWSGCKTMDPQAGEAATAADAKDVSPVPGGSEKDELAKVPVSLWSPGQRRANATYYFLTAEYAALKERDGKKVLPVYEAAYSLDPNPFLGGKMLAAKAAAGAGLEALVEARKMVLLYPRDSMLRFLYGDMLGRTGQNDEAATELEKCIELNPTYEPAYLELTELYQEMKQTPKAIVVAKDLTKHVPGSIVGWSQLSRLLIASNRYKEALVPARRAYEMQSNNPQLAQIYAIVLQLNGKTKQAVSIYEQLYRMDPTDQELTERMVALYREVGNLDQALSLLDELAKQEGTKKDGQGRPAVRMQKAILLWELKRNQEAAQLLDQLVKEYPDSDRLRYLAAVGHERLEDWDGALALYGNVPETSTFRYHADFRVVVILKQLKRYDEAIRHAREMMTTNQADSDLYGVTAGILADAKQYKEAVEVLDEGAKKFPDKPRLVFLRGVYQEKAGDLEGCIQTMREVIVKDPTNSSAYNYLGYLYVERKQNLDEAEQLIKRALELKPGDGFYMDSLGWLYYQKGDYDQALPLLEKALQAEPKEGVIAEHLADVRKIKGDKKGAQELYEKALKMTLEPKDRERIEAKAKEPAT